VRERERERERERKRRRKRRSEWGTGVVLAIRPNNLQVRLSKAA
jgi:hypothetical protein